MSEDFEERTRLYDSNVEGVFKELASGLAVDVDRIRTIVVEAYKNDLMELDGKTRLLDDVVAICEIGSAPGDDMEGGKYRKIVAALRGKGYIPNE